MYDYETILYILPQEIYQNIILKIQKFLIELTSLLKQLSDDKERN